VVRAFHEDIWSQLPADPEPWDLARQRALLLAQLRPGLRVLDLGCGAGRFSGLARAAGAKVVGVDIAEGALERARANVPGGDFRLVEEGAPLPLDDGEVELVWCSEVLQHVPDAARLLSEVRRVLRSGGRLVVTVPAWRLLRAPDPLAPEVRFYTRRSLRRVLHEFGFEDVEVSGRGSLTATAVRVGVGARPA